MIIARLSQIPYIVIVVRIVHYHEWRLFNFYALSALLGLWSNWLSDIQTVNTALLTMYSVDIVFFVVNISEMIYSNNPSVSLIPLALLTTLCYPSHTPLIFQSTQMVYKRGKIRYNLFHIQLIFVFFYITGLIISPYATYSNWFIHVFNFLLTVEISIVSQTREFRRCTLLKKMDPYYGHIVGTVFVY